MFAPALADTLTGFDPKFFAMLAEVESDHFWFVPRNRLLTQLIARHFPDAASFLEIGCGTGLVLSAVARMKTWAQICGSELHPAGLVEARKRLGPDVRLVQMDARVIPAREAFDVIGAFDVIEHIEEDEKVLAAMRDALAPGGGVVVAVPQHPALWSRVDEVSHHVRRYRRNELERKMQAADFRIAFSCSYNSFLLPAMLLSRLFQRKQSSTPEPATESLGVEFALPKEANGLLKGLLNLEVGLTLSGMRFPVGGSRIVVGMK